MRLPVLNRSIALLCVAAVAGVCAAWTARQYLQDRVRQLEANAKTPMVARVVAAYDMPSGTRLTPDHFAVRQLPASLASSDSLAPERFKELAGGVLVAPLRAGDPILAVHTARPQGSPFSARLGDGRRAITIPVDAINSVSGLLEPGDLIDLYVSFEHQRRRITAPLLQGVLVLATGKSTQIASEAGTARAGGYSTVTLDTSPEDAIKLVAARQGGSITALLRHPHDGRPDQKAVRGDLASLLGVSDKPVTTLPRKVPVIYGNQAARGLPGLRPQASKPAQVNGVFDLPYTPELVSAWMRRLAESDDAPRLAGSP
ncbi:MAG: Flp pilus assembly protein CpaB [Candidimonas sp.]|nr:MAG: Flp pilus assembly protein CpaB [Candidimonas sp.]TAM26297.1 MAG: Flp pilus assembly protein CpaB [Candidimonas sp.]TAM75125.1 MAG: Flp pilus assembly protein CpaB [Candidimonas sp.]